MNFEGDIVECSLVDDTDASFTFQAETAAMVVTSLGDGPADVSVSGMVDWAGRGTVVVVNGGSVTVTGAGSLTVLRAEHRASAYRFR